MEEYSSLSLLLLRGPRCRKNRIQRHVYKFRVPVLVSFAGKERNEINQFKSGSVILVPDIRSRALR